MYRGEGKCREGFLGIGGGGLKERDSLEALVVDVKIILKWGLKNKMGGRWMDSPG
jgi:hypothetical protein